jgi:hypothetical protein
MVLQLGQDSSVAGDAGSDMENSVVASGAWRKAVDSGL